VSSTNNPDNDIIVFSHARPSSEEEQLRRFAAEAERLARQPEVERAFRMAKSAETLGVKIEVLKAAVSATIKKRDDEERKQERKLQRREKDRARHEEKQRTDDKKEQEREQKQAEQEAKRQEREKRKAFGNLARLPVARHEKELERLAEKLGEDVAAVREEFEQDFLGVGTGEADDDTEAWSEPVDTASLLSEISAKFARYTVLQPHQMTAAVLWTAHCWLYERDVPVHSPLLALTSAEPDSGKTTAIAVIGRACPRYSLNVEMTGPSLFRFVDRIKPTLMIDEADDLFVRRSDLKHIVNAGWTRGAKIPRQERIGGALQTVWFDVFTPKAIALLGRNLPQATRTRAIEIRMVPKRADEKVENFDNIDDAEFAVLRQKLMRWSIDNAEALKLAKPEMPEGLNNRSAANWRLLLAIAKLAGGTWPERARDAAERLTRARHRKSDGVRLLTAIKTMLTKTRKSEITSETIVTELCLDPTDIWVEYNHGGQVTQRQIAWLLDAYDIQPQALHPTKRGNFARRGYKLDQFSDAFARYTLGHPIIRSQPNQRQKSVKRVKAKKRAKAKRR
jgi:putative DNA primase/helicase